MNNPSIAACILFHERASQTIECVHSLINTSNINIYVLNNNSSPKSVDQFMKIFNNYEQVKLLHSLVNLGVGVGRNFLIEHTTEEWLFFLDNDITIITPNWYDIILPKLNAQIAEVFIPKLFNQHEGQFIANNQIILNKDVADFQACTELVTNMFPGGASIVNRTLFNRLGLYDEQMFVGIEDFEFAIRGIIQNRPIKALCVPEIQLNHNHRKADNEEDMAAIKIRYDSKLIEDSYLRVCQKHNISLNNDWRPWVKNEQRIANGYVLDFISNYSIQFFTSVLKRHYKMGKTFAIWGSGEIGETLFNCCEFLHQQLICVIDASPSKQGSPFSNSQFTIQSPEYLLTHPVDVIVIASIKYLDQIMEEIATKYKLSSEIISVKGQFASADEGLRELDSISILEYDDQAKITDDKPQTCTLYLTDICNFKCNGCSRSTNGIKQFNDFNFDTVQKLIEVYPEITSFCIAGFGEPTFCKDFTRIVNYLKQNKKIVGIITNGSHIEPFFELQQEPDYISISLYGTNNEEYQSYCGVPVFDGIMENYKLLIQKYFNVGFSFILNKDNYRKLDAVIALCDQLNPKFLNLTNYLAYNIKQPEEIKRVITVKDDDIINYISSKCTKKLYIQTMPYYVDLDSNIFHCKSYHTMINLDGDGNISGCHRQIQPSQEYGNINFDTDPFHSKKMQNIRNNIRKGIFPHEQCKYCFGRFSR